MDIAITLRPVIRETMQLAPTRRWTVAALRSVLRAEHPDATEADISQALAFNQSKGYVDYQHQAELQVDHWYLTERGKNTPV